MFRLSNVILLIFVLGAVLAKNPMLYQPEQVHIAFGADVNEFVITWTTLMDVGKDGALVEYGIDDLTMTAKGTSEKFVDGGSKKREIYIHRVSK